MDKSEFREKGTQGTRKVARRGFRKALSQRGVASVEMALMLPVLVLLLLGVIDVSRAAFIGIKVINAASTGALYGAQGPAFAVDTSAIGQAAQDDASISGMSVSSSVFCECSDGSASTCSAGDCSSSRMMSFVQVDTSASWTPMFSYPGIPSSVALKGHSVVQVSE